VFGAYADEKPRVLVAKPELGEFYAQTVLLAVPARNGHHIGVIVNRPTPMTLGRLIPDHVPSKAVTDPVYLGGPSHVNSIFAMYQGDNPGSNTIPLMDGLWLVVDSDLVDKIIENEPLKARFIAGMVIWDAEELDAEVKSGFWFETEMTVDELLAVKPGEQGWAEQVAKLKGSRI
jgi:putative transcriptional regulator